MGAVMVQGLINLAALAVAYVVLATFLQRRFGPLWPWVLWGISLLAAGWFALRVSLEFDPDMPPLFAIYMLSCFVGLPTGAATWLIVRRTVRAPGASFVRQAGVGLIGLIAVLPVALLLGALPDIARLW